ncbi:LysR family transcriptional regulator [Ruminococcaceae bacterium OttesenSCG-928-D13]|nr:LysR family transcriptional regulator [Ruminococcaceae bacterium OttesenSCG-928-D13]
MIDCNLEYYRAFYYVAQLASISKAANALYLSQPSVTRSIKKLEEYHGVSLFARDYKGAHLTTEGEQLFQNVDIAFSSLIEGEKLLKKIADFEMGKLSIGATETALNFYLLPKLEAFRELYPQILIHASGSSTQDTVRMLNEGQVDLSLAVSPLEDVGLGEDVQVTPIFDFQDIFVAGPYFSKLEGCVLTARELSEQPLVMVERGTSARKNIDLWFESQGVLFEPDYSVRTTSNVVPFVQRNLAIGIMPSMFAHNLLEREGFFRVQTEGNIPKREVVLMVQNAKAMSHLCRVFIEFMKTHN